MEGRSLFQGSCLDRPRSGLWAVFNDLWPVFKGVLEKRQGLN